VLWELPDGFKEAGCTSCCLESEGSGRDWSGGIGMTFLRNKKIRGSQDEETQLLKHG